MRQLCLPYGKGAPARRQGGESGFHCSENRARIGPPPIDISNARSTALIFTGELRRKERLLSGPL